MILEELLNKLIEKGWTKKTHHLYGLPNKPFVRRVKDSIHGVEFYYYEWRDNEAKLVKIYSLRDIVSKESGLWQFCVERGMVKTIGSEIEIKNLNEGYGVVRDTDYQYRGIVSYLKDESELESFILDNIKIDG